MISLLVVVTDLCPHTLSLSFSPVFAPSSSQGTDGQQHTVVAAVEDATTAEDDDDPYVTAAEEEGTHDGDLAPLASATFASPSPTTATNAGPLIEPSGDVPAIREVAPPPATTEGMVEVSAVQAPGKMPQVQGTEQVASMVEDVVDAVGEVRSYTGLYGSLVACGLGQAACVSSVGAHFFTCPSFGTSCLALRPRFYRWPTVCYHSTTYTPVCLR